MGKLRKVTLELTNDNSISVSIAKPTRDKIGLSIVIAREVVEEMANRGIEPKETKGKFELHP